MADDALNDIINAIAEAIPRIGAERIRLDAKRGIEPVDVFDPHFLDRYNDPNGPQGQLRGTLMGFDQESLLWAEALFFYGRDRDARFSEKLRDLRSRAETKSKIVEIILNKIPAWTDSICEAISRLKKEGLSITMISEHFPRASCH